MSQKISEYAKFKRIRPIFSDYKAGHDSEGRSIRVWHKDGVFVLLKFYPNKMWNFWVVDQSTKKKPRVYKDFEHLIEKIKTQEEE